MPELLTRMQGGRWRAAGAEKRCSTDSGSCWPEAAICLIPGLRAMRDTARKAAGPLVLAWGAPPPAAAAAALSGLGRPLLLGVGAEGVPG